MFFLRKTKKIILETKQHFFYFFFNKTVKTNNSMGSCCSAEYSELDLTHESDLKRHEIEADSGQPCENDSSLIDNNNNNGPSPSCFSSCRHEDLSLPKQKESTEYSIDENRIQNTKTTNLPSNEQDEPSPSCSPSLNNNNNDVKEPETKTQNNNNIKNNSHRNQQPETPNEQDEENDVSNDSDNFAIQFEQVEELDLLWKQVAKKESQKFIPRRSNTFEREVGVDEFSGEELCTLLRQAASKYETNHPKKAKLEKLIQNFKQIKLKLEELNMELTRDRAYRLWVRRLRNEWKNCCPLLVKRHSNFDSGGAGFCVELEMSAADIDAKTDDEIVQMMKSKKLFAAGNNLGAFLNHWHNLGSRRPAGLRARAASLVHRHDRSHQQRQEGDQEAREVRRPKGRKRNAGRQTSSWLLTAVE